IDAASNTGVDNIRELIERAQFAPVQCRYKLYVLDEVHMLSTAAFNALLKTLEEPPDRVVFVLATTDPQRVLPTIISRCQRFDFRRIPLPAAIRHLSHIATEEAIEITPPAVQLVAQISQGGLRDAESLLDQLSLQADEITVETVWDLVGAVPERDLLNLVRAIAADDSTALLERTRHLMDKGREPLIILQSLVGFYRDLLIAKSAPTRADLVAITPPSWAEMTDFVKRLSTAQLLASQQKLQSAEVQVKNTTQPRLWLEITLTSLLPSALGAAASLATGDRHFGKVSAQAVLSVANRPLQPSPTSVSKPSPASEAAALSVSPTTQPAPEPAIDPALEPVTEPATEPVTEPATEPATEVAFGSLNDLWQKILAALAPRGTQMLMNQQGTLLAFDGVGAKVGFRSASLQKMAQARIPNLEAAFEAVFQRPIKVSLEVASAKAAAETTAASTPAAPLPTQKTPPPAPFHRPSDPPTGDSATNGHAANSQKVSSPTPKQPPDTKADTATGAPSSALPSGLPSAPSASQSSSLGQWQVNQDQDNIKRFAQFFNGQIVNLDDDLDDDLEDSFPSSEQASPNQASSGQTSSDPGPDVPF
ncbi:MAG: DNA polymerase III subunit gamma/tau, partial [Phormidesmis sp.]